MSDSDSLVERLLGTYGYLERDERKENEALQENLIQRIVETDYQSLESKLKQLISTKKIVNVDLALDVIGDLLTYAKIDINPYLVLFFEVAKEYLPGSLFRAANAETKRLLKTRLDTDNHHALSALAWCADEFAANQFFRWKMKPPIWWQPEVHMEIDSCTYDAGWELDDFGGVRLLYSPNCFGIDAALMRETDENSAEACTICQRPLYRIKIESGLLNEILPVKADFQALTIPFCDLCCRWETLSKLEGDKVEVDFENLYNEDVPKWIKKWDKLGGTFILKRDSQARNPFFAVDQMMLRYKRSQLGGHPTWIQNPEYPKCVSCKKSMYFIMQLEGEEVFPENNDMTYYVFFCTECKDRFTVTQQFD